MIIIKNKNIIKIINVFFVTALVRAPSCGVASLDPVLVAAPVEVSTDEVGELYTNCSLFTMECNTYLSECNRVSEKHNIQLLMSYRPMSFSCHITQTGWHIPLPLIHQLWRIGCNKK